LWLHILCSHVSIAWVAKKPISIWCLHLTTRLKKLAGSMQVLQHQTQKLVHIVKIICEYYNLNPKDSMHIMCKLQLQSHYTCDLLFDVGIA
jgi:hypothetical protein